MKTKNAMLLLTGIFVTAMGAGFVFSLAVKGDDHATKNKRTQEGDGADRALYLEDEGFGEPEEEPSTKNHGAIANPMHKDTVIAWQPSHQDDTGTDNWHEYQICNDIVERAISLSTGVVNVKCWGTSHGLTGTNRNDPQPTNTIAFDVEIDLANRAQADYFISVHNDSGAPSGILGLCIPGDKLSRLYLEKALDLLCKKTGLPNRGVWEVKLYSLETERNTCPVRFILEIGDNVKDRDKLMNPEFRQQVAQALSEFVNSLPSLR
jgi:hypothetical protein